jgi:hypothetical protein
MIPVGTGISGRNDTASVGTDIWATFRAALTKTELEALTIILNGQDIRAFSVEHVIMPEVLVDGINQKAVDCIGDTVMEFDGIVAVYDDYIERLRDIGY